MLMGNSVAFLARDLEIMFTVEIVLKHDLQKASVFVCFLDSLHLYMAEV